MTNAVKTDGKKRSNHQMVRGKRLGLPLAHAGRSHASRRLHEENRRILDGLKVHSHK
jgi:hypothetical protein